MNSVRTNIRNDLQLILDDIRVCESKVQFQSLKELYERLMFVVEDNKLDIYMPKEANELLNKMNTKDLYVKNITAFINNYKKYKDFDLEFAKLERYLNKYFNELYSYPEYEKPTKLHENIIMLNHILKNYDYELCSFYENMITSGHLHTCYGSKGYTDGYVVEGNAKIKPYIFVYLSNTITDLLTIAHEVVHAYISVKRLDNKEKEVNKININNFDETYSMFMELVVQDYLKNNQILSNDLFTYKQEFNNNMIEDLKIYRSYLKKKRLFTRDTDINLYIESQKYAQGRVFAYHFFNQYLQDKDMAKDNIYNFMLKSHIHDKGYMINHYGLSEKELVNPKYLIKHM